MSLTEFMPSPETPEAYLERVLATWVGRLRLSHWEITLELKERLDESDAFAEINANPHYDTATLKLGQFERWDPHFLNCTIVHELLHLGHRDTDESVNAIEDHVPNKSWELIEARYRHAYEGFVDRTATALVALGGIV